MIHRQDLSIDDIRANLSKEAFEKRAREKQKIRKEREERFQKQKKDDLARLESEGHDDLKEWLSDVSNFTFDNENNRAVAEYSCMGYDDWITYEKRPGAWKKWAFKSGTPPCEVMEHVATKLGFEAEKRVWTDYNVCFPRSDEEYVEIILDFDE